MATNGLDALSGLVMVTQSQPGDLITIALRLRRTPLRDFPDLRRPRTFCREFLLQWEYRKRHRNDSVRTHPDDIGLMIAHDDLADAVRKRHYVVHAVERPTLTNWNRCVHCERIHRHP